MYFQQGDVLAKKRESIPEGFERIKSNLIHQGRDNPHTIEGEFELHTKGELMFIDAKSECRLVHPEHKTITLPVGVYEKGIVVEFDHLLEESRQVID